MLELNVFTNIELTSDPRFHYCPILSILGLAISITQQVTAAQEAISVLDARLGEQKTVIAEAALDKSGLVDRVLRCETELANYEDELAELKRKTDCHVLLDLTSG